MSFPRGHFGRESYEEDFTFTGTVEILAAPGASRAYIIRTLTLSSDLDFVASLRSAATRKGPKLWVNGPGGASLSDMEIRLGYNEAFNIAFTGGGDGSVYVEYEIAG